MTPRTPIPPSVPSTPRPASRPAFTPLSRPGFPPLAAAALLVTDVRPHPVSSADLVLRGAPAPTRIRGDAHPARTDAPSGPSLVPFGSRSDCASQRPGGAPSVPQKSAGRAGMRGCDGTRPERRPA